MARPTPLTLVESLALAKMAELGYTQTRMGNHLKRGPRTIKRELQKLGIIEVEDEPEALPAKKAVKVGGVAVGDTMGRKKGSVVMTRPRQNEATRFASIAEARKEIQAGSSQEFMTES
jgi:hypothetical protein